MSHHTMPLQTQTPPLPGMIHWCLGRTTMGVRQSMIGSASKSLFMSICFRSWFHSVRPLLQGPGCLLWPWPGLSLFLRPGLLPLLWLGHLLLQGLPQSRLCYPSPVLLFHCCVRSVLPSVWARCGLSLSLSASQAQVTLEQFLVAHGRYWGLLARSWCEAAGPVRFLLAEMELH